MTPQERQLVDDLFDRLSKLETAPRDPDAAAAISQGLRRAPNAVYALVQTTLLQDEALKRANARIQELEGGEPEQPPVRRVPGFDARCDLRTRPRRAARCRMCVRPSSAAARPGIRARSCSRRKAPDNMARRHTASPMAAPQAPMGGGGGSFLGTAAAAAAGVVGGGLLMSSIRRMMGGGHQSGFGDSAGLGGGGGRTPWSSDQSNSDLARDAGINDIGSGGHRADDSSRAGFFDQASNDD